MTFARWDKIITMHFVSSARKILSLTDLPAVPILMYHSISDPDGRFSHQYYETGTSPRVFKEQMKFLDETGYYSIDLSELPAAFEKDSGGRKPVVITSDDGYKDFLVNAFPIMDRYGFTPTVFLIFDGLVKSHTA